MGNFLRDGGGADLDFVGAGFVAAWRVDDEMDFDIWDGDLLHVNKPLNNGTILFEVIDSHGDVVL